jgi:hypothetical protein
MPSRVIADFRYDAERRELTVGFVSGRRYCYQDVPPDIAAAFRAAFSRGQYFNAEIRDRFAFTRRR